VGNGGNERGRGFDVMEGGNEGEGKETRKEREGGKIRGIPRQK
jgi:hypothetical protein